MIIAIASGKGGTGKTTMSVAFALSIDEPVQLLDCDVEEPNAKIFLDIKELEEENVYTLIPRVDTAKCTFCGKCQEVCQFNAITVLKDKVLIFDELCHSCGGCVKVCKYKALSETSKPIGTVLMGKVDNISFVQGKLDIGRPMSPPLIRAVKSRTDKNIVNIIDCPPGNSCPVITAISGADYVILVTEASPFGLHDLALSVDTLVALSLPFGVIINKADTGYTQVKEYCYDEGIQILLEIPESMKIAKAYSSGKTLLDAMPQMKDKIKSIIREIVVSIK